MQQNKLKANTIVLNSKDNEAHRKFVRKIQEVAGSLTEAGFTKIKSFGGMASPNIRSFFNVLEDNHNMVFLEFLHLDSDEIQEIKDFIDVQKASIIQEVKDFTYNDNLKVTRFLIDAGKI